MRSALLLAALGILSAAPALAWEHDLPDPKLTPGAVLDVTAEQVCVPGYSKSVRHVTAATKAQVFTAYGLPGNHTGYCGGRQGCEVDHLISLELGVSNVPANLWPQSHDSRPWNAHLKDRLENRLHEMVCSGAMSLADAQRMISADWTSAYRQMFGDPDLSTVREER